MTTIKKSNKNKLEFKEVLTEDETDNFPIAKNFRESNSYKEDYEKALKFANRKKGFREVYTMVDGDDNHTHYIKGLHWLNRFGYCVLGVK